MSCTSSARQADVPDTLAALQTWRVEEIDGNVMTLRGEVLAAGPFTGRAFVAGQHGGLTVIHGGGNRLLQVDGTYDIGANSVTRVDGLSWLDDGYAIGDIVQIGAEGTTRTIVGFAGTIADCPFDDTYEGCGDNSIMLLDGDPLAAGTGGAGLVYESRPFEARADTDMDISVQGATAPALPTTTLTRYDGGSFVDEGFLEGMLVTISGFIGNYEVAAVSPNELVLANAALPPTLTGLAGSNPTQLIVVGYDPARAAVGTDDDTVQIGGDHIVVCSDSAVDDQGDPVPCGDVVDVDAAGWGWYFTPGAADVTGIDPYSVLLHEVGHVLGYEHTDTGLMAGTIEPGATLSLEVRPSTVVTPAGAAAAAADRAVDRAHDVMLSTAEAFNSAVPVINPIEGLTVGGTADRAAEETRAALEASVRPVRVSLSAAPSADGALRAAFESGHGPSGAPMAIQLAVALIAIAFLGRRRLT